MGLLLSLLLGFLPAFIFAWIVYGFDRYEKEPLPLLGGVFLWGALVASGAAFMLNTGLEIGVYLLTHSESVSDLATGSLIAPVIEEILKGFAVLIVFLAMRHEFDSLLDGVVYAAIVALGFAATENSYYIYEYGYAQHGLGGLLWLAFVRVVLVGWQHPFYTAFFGIGLAIARLNRSTTLKIVAPLTGLVIAIFAHAFHNTMSAFLKGIPGLALGTLIDWTGWVFMLLFIVWAIYREQRWISAHLREEVALGLLSPAQYRVACSSWAQSGARLNALFSGRYRNTNRFYQTCAELAHKKEQLRAVGDEDGNSQIIARLRQDLGQLGKKVSA